MIELIADGQTDDAQALQAWWNGEPVHYKGELMSDDMDFHGATLHIKTPVHYNDNRRMSNANILFSDAGRLRVDYDKMSEEYWDQPCTEQTR